MTILRMTGILVALLLFVTPVYAGKISARQSATTPLTGAETIGIIQGGLDRKTTLASFGTCTAPEAYGAVGDGATNDAPAIALALADIVATRGHLCFGPHIYAVGTSSWVGFTIASKSNFVIQGRGTTLKLLVQPSQDDLNGASKPLFKITGSTDFEIAGITFDMNGIASQAIYSDSHSRSRIHDNRFTSSGGISYGVYLTRGVDARLTGNHCDGIFHCFYLGHTDASYHESRFSIVGNTGKTLGGGDFVVGVMKDGTISGNSVDGMFSGVALSGLAGTSAYSDNVTVTGNTFKNPTAHCVQIDNSGAVTAKNLTITGNACYAPAVSGIYLSGGVDGFVVSGNMIRDSVGQGINISAPANNGTVTGNTLDTVNATPTNGGILINADNTANGVVNLTVTGNLVRGYDCAGCTGISLTMASTGTGKQISITGNITEANTRGITVTSAVGDFTDLVVANNNTHNNSAYDVRFDASDIKGIFTNKFDTDPGFSTFLTFTDLDTTPSIKGRSYWLSSNSGATNITNFTNGKQGDVITIECTTAGANNTIKNGATIVLSGAADYSCSANRTLTLQLRGTVWKEIGRGAN